MLCFLFLLFSNHASAENKSVAWELVKSEVSYKVEHPLKTAVGVSQSAKGKGNCSRDTCQFLVAVPVKTFDSGDSNRDLHMLEVTRGGTYPMVVVRATTPNVKIVNLGKRTVPVDMEIEFSGQKAKYPNVSLEMDRKSESEVVLTGVIPVRLDDFKIDRPSLLTIPIKNEVPITVDSVWHAH